MQGGSYLCKTNLIFIKNTWFCGAVCAQNCVQPEGAQTGPGQSGFEVSSLLSRAQYQPSSTGAGTGWCEVRAQEEIKLLWTELSRELSSWISSFSSREPQRAISGCPSFLEQQQLGKLEKRVMLLLLPAAVEQGRECA